MQAFMAGKVRVEGDMAKLMALQAPPAAADPNAAEMAAKLRDITGVAASATSCPSTGAARRPGQWPDEERTRDHASAATTAPTQNATLKLCSSAVLWCTLAKPGATGDRLLNRQHHLNPRHLPTWAASSCAALITPYSDSASSFDMVADVAGMETPMPKPESASATRMTASPESAAAWRTGPWRGAATRPEERGVFAPLSAPSCSRRSAR